MSIAEAGALFFGIVMPFAILFHLIRMHREKSSKGQSFWTPGVGLIGTLFWLAYSVEIDDYVLQTTNILWLLFSILHIGFILYYRGTDNVGNES